MESPELNAVAQLACKLKQDDIRRLIEICQLLLPPAEKKFRDVEDKSKDILIYLRHKNATQDNPVTKTNIFRFVPHATKDHIDTWLEKLRESGKICIEYGPRGSTSIFLSTGELDAIKKAEELRTSKRRDADHLGGGDGHVQGLQDEGQPGGFPEDNDLLGKLGLHPPGWKEQVQREREDRERRAQGGL